MINPLACLHFPMEATWINKGVCPFISLYCALWHFVVSWWHFHAAGGTLKKFFLHLLFKTIVQFWLHHSTSSEGKTKLSGLSHT